MSQIAPLSHAVVLYEGDMDTSEDSVYPMVDTVLEAVTMPKIPSFSLKLKGKEELIKLSSSFFEKLTPPPLKPAFPAKPRVRNPAKLVTYCLDNYAGFCLGENHADPASKEFLCTHMARLKEEKVDVIFMEHFRTGQQKDLDAYPYSSKNLFSSLLYKQEAHCEKVIQTAKAHGIRVIGIDTEDAYMRNPEQNASAEELKTRMQTMNYYALHVMKKQSLPEGKKFVALMGAAHLRNYEGIPGLSELLGVPDVIVRTKSKKEKETPDLTFEVKKHNCKYNANALVHV